MHTINLKEISLGASQYPQIARSVSVGMHKKTELCYNFTSGTRIFCFTQE